MAEVRGLTVSVNSLPKALDRARLWPRRDGPVWMAQETEEGRSTRSLMLHYMSPLLAQSGHANRRDPRQLSGVKRTQIGRTVAAAFDPKRTSDRHNTVAD
jgi:hypothetical protein